jgi:hypothetical protein
MSAVVPGRWTTVRGEPFVVFLIGMRINRLWALNRWVPVAAAMPRMLKELAQRPELGYLGGHAWAGRTFTMLQYWRSVEHLNAYAKARDHLHLPAWTRFNRLVAASGAVGVYHETYAVSPGSHECIYVNMPPFGLGGIDTLQEASGKLAAAAGRMSGGLGAPS